MPLSVAVGDDVAVVVEPESGVAVTVDGVGVTVIVDRVSVVATGLGAALGVGVEDVAALISTNSNRICEPLTALDIANVCHPSPNAAR